MLTIFKKNYQFTIFLIFYIFIGAYLSISNGITSDEYHEQLNWEVNFSAIVSFLKNGSYNELLNYGDRYHGIGFHYISQPIQILFHKLISDLNDLSIFGAYLVSKHLAVFLLFTVSGVFFYLLSFKLTKSLGFSFISTLLYLLYPYLFGHAQFNPKDIPFLSFWLINSYISLTVIESFFLEEKITIRKIIILSFMTAFLISLRIVGLLILLQYLIGMKICHLQHVISHFLQQSDFPHDFQ